MVLEPGEFSVRGHIIDIFAQNHTHPIRIEYEDNHIERLCSFAVNTQRTLTHILETEIHRTTTKDPLNFNLESHNTELLFECKEGDFIVHEDFGIGIFSGCVRLTVRNKETEYILIQYKGEDKAFVPLNQIQKCHKYSGHIEAIEINGLHDGMWLKKKRKAKKHAESIAEDIYFMYKIRLCKPGFAFKEDSETQLLFEKAFKHKLTQDQDLSLKEIKADMEKDIPMDRLLCGDVGYGKTEVMLRAAFKALENGKQVAVLCPTTLLANQHGLLFKTRIDPFYYRVDTLSRFTPKKEQKKTIERLEKGHTDLVVGTHRILSQDMRFKNLGLLIIDEEQRFGVKQKESLKKTFPLVDILNVSATPIPRTLHLSMTGARDISLIKTPPPGKKEVITQILRYDETRIQDAINQEIQKGGQVFYMLNAIKKLKDIEHTLKKAFPNLSIRIAHAKQSATYLETTMQAFIDKKIDILISTTIIENGLNLENANTIIIDHADQLGLSQIHQLRGRVGRGSKQAYAYLVYHPKEAVNPTAQKRLQAIKEYSALGSGYYLALKDLEIRGAGSIFGAEQHGNIADVGFQLYCRLLEESVHKAKGKTIIRPQQIQLNPEKITLSESYIPNTRERLALYNRMFSLQSLESLKAMEAELLDRYGNFTEKELDVFNYLNTKISPFLK